MDKILIVDDDRFSQALFSGLLRGGGCEPVCVDSGLEALEMFRNGDFRAMVISLSIPDISGLDLLLKVKQLEPAMEVIIVTNHGNTDSAISALKKGARDYLVKPLNHEEFKHSIALSLEQRRLLDENSELKGLVNLFQTGQTIANCIETDRLYGIILDAMLKEVGLTRGLFSVYNESQYLVKELRNLSPESAKILLPLLVNKYPVEDIKPGCFVTVNGSLIPLLDALPLSDKGLKDTLLIYIKSRNSLHGIVILFNEDGSELPSSISHGNITFLVDQSYLALENAVRYSKAKDMLNVDELTGLYNYRYLDIALEHEIRRSERFKTGFAVIFLDIDLLKQVNDRHGHLMGSKVLKEMGALLKKSLRDVDIIIRYGGDEFTLILVESNLDATAAVCERIRKTIETNSFLADEKLNLSLTASLGYACYPTDTKTKNDLLEMADKAMYHSKFSGKNRVFHASSLLTKERKNELD